MKKVLSLALCLLLCLGLCATAFAEGTPYDATTGYATDLTKTGLVKQLSIVEGVKDTGFVFTFDFVGTQTMDGESAKAGYYKPANITETIGSAASSETRKMTVSGDKQSGAIYFSELFAKDKLASHGITHAGVWTYTVTEKSVNADYSQDFTKIEETDDYIAYLKKTMESSTDTYYVTLIVKNGTDGTPEVEGIITQKAGVEGKQNTTITEETPGTPGTSGTSGSSALTSGFQFNNKYTEEKKTEPKGDKKYAALSVEKIVGPNDDGDDYGDHTEPFLFTLTLTAPSNTTMDPITVTIDRDTKQPINRSVEGKPVTDEITFTFTDGVAEKSFYLSDNDILYFESLPVGLKYSVSETADARYTSSVTGTNSGTIATTEGAVNSMNAEVTNVAIYVPPEGVVINNLPFALLVVLAVGGIAVYFVSSRRRNDEA